MSNQDNFDREKIKQGSDEMKKELNADPITGEPGSHPLGTSIGAVGGAAVGAAVGSGGGPVGTLIGGAIGALVGGVAGNATGEIIDPTVEDAYWRENYSHQPYYHSARSNYPDLDYERDYKDAYRVGYEKRFGYESDVAFEEVEPEIKSNWENVKGESRLSWEEARKASRDAWNRHNNK